MRRDEGGIRRRSSEGSGRIGTIRRVLTQIALRIIRFMTRRGSLGIKVTRAFPVRRNEGIFK